MLLNITYLHFSTSSFSYQWREKCLGKLSTAFAVSPDTSFSAFFWLKGTHWQETWDVAFHVLCAKCANMRKTVHQKVIKFSISAIWKDNL